MRFKAGDRVVHPTYGVGDIVRIEESRLAEEEPRLYYVIIADKSTVWVPVGAQAAAALRELTPKVDLDTYRQMLRSRPVTLQKDYQKRRAEIAERLSRGTFQALCEIVRDLTARSWKKSLIDAEAILLQRLREVLCREWAAAEGVPLALAFKEVETLLVQARQAHPA